MALIQPKADGNTDLTDFKIVQGTPSEKITFSHSQ
jgi:hypothetical protein